MGEVITGVQLVVPQELKGPSVKLVRAGFALDADHSARRKAVMSIEIVGDDTEFLRRVGIRKRRCQKQVGIEVRYAIQKIVRAALAAAPGRRAGLRRKGRLSLLDPSPGVQHVADTGRQQNQAGRIAAVEREFFDGALLHHLADFS